MVILFAFPISCTLGIAFYVSTKNIYASEGKDKPYPFKERGKIKLTIDQSKFIREYTTRVRRPKSSGGGGGGRTSRSSGRSSRSSGGKF